MQGVQREQRKGGTVLPMGPDSFTPQLDRTFPCHLVQKAGDLFAHIYGHEMPMNVNRDCFHSRLIKPDNILCSQGAATALITDVFPFYCGRSPRCGRVGACWDDSGLVRNT